MWSEYVKTFCGLSDVEVNFVERQTVPYADVKKRRIICPRQAPKGLEPYFGTLLKHEVGHILFSGQCGSLIANAIEDIRIEKLMGTSFYGIGKEFKVVRNFMSDSIFEKLDEMGEKVPISPHTIAFLVSDYLFSGSDRALKYYPEKVRETFKKHKNIIKRLFLDADNSEDINEMGKYVAKVFEVPNIKDQKMEMSGGSKEDDGDDGKQGKQEKMNDEMKELLKKMEKAVKIEEEGKESLNERKYPEMETKEGDYDYELSLEVIDL